MPMLIRLCLLLVAGALPAAHAARPMVTDDARLTDAGACQVEGWGQSFRDSHEFWALPACNPGGNFEFTAGGANARAQDGQNAGAQLIQGKTLFKPLDTNGYGIGLAAGSATQTMSAHSGNPYAYVPISFSLADDRAVIHTNLGWTRDRSLGEHRMTWGIGSEIQIADHTYLIAESFGQHVGQPYIQFGLRHWLVPGHVQVDTTYGNRFGHFPEARWFSIGLRLISPSFFGL